MARARCTTGPPAMSDSLFASARRAPASSAAKVTPRPAKPTTALSTTSASRAMATSDSGPAQTSVPAGTCVSSAAAFVESAMATRLGRRAWACSASRSMDDAAPRATTS